MEREYPEVDGEHHVGPRRLEAAVDPILLGVRHPVKNKVDRNLVIYVSLTNKKFFRVSHTDKKSSINLCVFSQFRIFM